MIVPNLCFVSSITNPVSLYWARCRKVGLTALLALLLTALSCHADQTVTLTGDPWPPYVEGELGQEARSGIVVELVQRVFSRLEGVEASFPLIPWNRALKEVEEGTKDGIVALLKSAERERYMVYTDPLFESRNLVWYSSTRFPRGFNWDRIDDLAAYRVGITKGYTYGEDIDQAIETGLLPVVRVPTVDRLFAMLARDRVDMALANDNVGYALAGQYASGNELVAADKATGKDVHYMAFSKKSPAQDLVPRVNRILSELRAEGVFEELFFRNGTAAEQAK